MIDLAPSPPPSGLTAQEVVDRIAEAAKSSFATGIRLVPRSRRPVMRAVYAFCRVVDDIADGPIERAEKTRLLAEWHAEVDRIDAGTAQSAIGMVLTKGVRRFGVPPDELHMVLEGMEMDVQGPVRAPSADTLDRYIRRVSGAVGLVSMHVFGAWRGERSRVFALALAEALQLVNIIRDIEEDAAEGRIYVPSECLASAGIAADPGALVNAPALPDIRRTLGARARDAFARARGAMPGHRRRTLLPALAMMGVYERYLDRIERAGWHGVPEMKRSAKVRAAIATALWPGRR